MHMYRCDIYIYIYTYIHVYIYTYIICIVIMIKYTSDNNSDSNRMYNNNASRWTETPPWLAAIAAAHVRRRTPSIL